MFTLQEYTVLDLNSSVKELLERGFPGEFWIRGVVTGLRQVSGRGHTYFQLAHPSGTGGQSPAVVDCALFAGDRAAVAMETGRQGAVFDLKENTEVRIRARINFWERSGRFQIVMKGFDHTFQSESTAIHLQKLVRKLTEEGVIGENATLSLPALPLTLGLITSRDSAAERDFLKTLEESRYPFRVYARYASMQGSETAESVCGAFAVLLTSGVSGELDAVVLTRGGGSATDLAWFNDERIARTIAQLPWPVISGIGHEIDTTLPDHAAHTRAKTPTHAASMLVDMVAGFDERVSRMSRGVVSAFSPRIAMERMRLQNISRNLALSLSSLPRRKREELHRMVSALIIGVNERVSRCERELTRLENRLDMRNPEKMLSLGWSIVRDSRGKPVKDASAIDPGDLIGISMQGGNLKALVKEKEK